MFQRKSGGLRSASAKQPKRVTLALPLVVAAFGLAVVPGIASARSFSGRIMTAAAARKAAKQDPNAGTLGPAARRAIHRGYLVPHQARYDRRKARITRRATARQELS